MVEVRLANTGDSYLVYDLRNQPEVVRFSFSQEKFSFDDHDKWFSQKLLSDESFFLIVVREGKGIGVIRFDYSSEYQFEISIFLQSEIVGKGIGGEALEKAILLLKKNKKVTHILANVHTDNIASLKFFLKNSFYESSRELDKVLFIRNC
jgi:UDP-2,4-diacetamido-2,4,6-trideoxy-beta-L-altropyranose hydrolase